MEGSLAVGEGVGDQRLKGVASGGGAGGQLPLRFEAGCPFKSASCDLRPLDNRASP